MHKYVRKIEKLCGEKEGFMVLFRDELVEEVLSILYKNLNITRVKPLVRVKINGYEVNIFKTGKMIIKGISDEETLWNLLNGIYYGEFQ